MEIEKLYKDTVKLLEEAYDQYKTHTNNQQGMPAHLMHVARLFGEVCANVEKLEKRAIKDSRRWTKSLFGNNSSSNNNNNNNNSKRRTKKHKKNHNT